MALTVLTSMLNCLYTLPASRELHNVILKLRRLRGLILTLKSGSRIPGQRFATLTHVHETLGVKHPDQSVGSYISILDRVALAG